MEILSIYLSIYEYFQRLGSCKTYCIPFPSQVNSEVLPVMSGSSVGNPWIETWRVLGG